MKYGTPYRTKAGLVVVPRQNLFDRFLRLDVIISRNDDRLHNVFLYSNPNRNGDPLWDECLEWMRHVWVFFGDVKPKNIRPGLLECPTDAELRKVFDDEMRAMGVDPAELAT